MKKYFCLGILLSLLVASIGEAQPFPTTYIKTNGSSILKHNIPFGTGGWNYTGVGTADVFDISVLGMGYIRVLDAGFSPHYVRGGHFSLSAGTEGDLQIVIGGATYTVDSTITVPVGCDLTTFTIASNGDVSVDCSGITALGSIAIYTAAANYLLDEMPSDVYTETSGSGTPNPNLPGVGGRGFFAQRLLPGTNSPISAIAKAKGTGNNIHVWTANELEFMDHSGITGSVDKAVGLLADFPTLGSITPYIGIAGYFSMSAANVNYSVVTGLGDAIFNFWRQANIVVAVRSEDLQRPVIYAKTSGGSSGAGMVGFGCVPDGNSDYQFEGLIEYTDGANYLPPTDTSQVGTATVIGGTASFLGVPDLWLTIRSGGNYYVVPAYSGTAP